MPQVLRQSTQIDVRLGPFVDATDAVTPETGITLGAADQAELLKADGAATVDISGRTWAAVTGANGWYDLTLTTTDTNTTGTLDVVVQDSSVCLPVFARFQVVEENVFDALYASSAALGTDVASILTDTGTTLDGKLNTIDTNVDAILVDTGTTLPGTLTTIDTVVDAILVDTDTTIPGLIAALNDITAANVLAETVEGSYDVTEALRLILAACVGKLSGAATTTVNIRDTADTKNRISATVDADGNRSAVTLNAT